MKEIGDMRLKRDVPYAGEAERRSKDTNLSTFILSNLFMLDYSVNLSAPKIRRTDSRGCVTIKMVTLNLPRQVPPVQIFPNI